MQQVSAAARASELASWQMTAIDGSDWLLRGLRGRILSLSDQVEEIEEFREADGGRIGSLDQGLAFCAQSGHAEGHGDAVVAAGVDDGAVQRLTAGHIETVFELGHFGSYGAEILDHQGDAVRFLDA